ncbi:Cytoplasmic thioredoxin isoenzyme 2 [Tulasnella sp. 427]|nr:Cytoplasmic thioredoxin isoenzyme 2 [Tulasnella sp. 427]
MVEYLTKLDDFRAKINSGKPVVIDFTAAWCGPCKMISPIFETLSQQPEFAGLECYKVDVDEAEGIAKECGITAMPTFKVFKNGQPINEMRGANPPGLQNLLQSALTAE